MKNAFIDDIEKMTDLLTFIVENPKGWKEQFMESYSYLTEEEVDETVKEINGQSLAYLYRTAENMYIEEMNGRKTGLKTDSETAKTAIINAVNTLPECEADAFNEVCESMGC